jgi:hypothetical protein
MDQTPIDRT